MNSICSLRIWICLVITCAFSAGLNAATATITAKAAATHATSIDVNVFATKVVTSPASAIRVTLKNNLSQTITGYPFTVATSSSLSDTVAQKVSLKGLWPNQTYTATIEVLTGTGTSQKSFLKFTGSFKTNVAQILVLVPGLGESNTTFTKFAASLSNGTSDPYASGTVNALAVTLAAVEGSQNLIVYRVGFGTTEAALTKARVGADPTCKSGTNTNGDFETYQELGLELGKCLTNIRTKYGDSTATGCKFVLVTHSRGGVAARVMLADTTNANARSSVIGVVTLGAMQQGTPLGRAYKYLANDYTSNKNIKADLTTWGLVSKITNVTNIDVRRLATDYIAPESTAFAGIAAKDVNLPTTIKYYAIRYSGQNLGQFDPACNIFVGYLGLRYKISDAASAAILGTKATGGSYTYDNPDYQGDGVVPLASQSWPNPKASSNVSTMTYNNATLHMAEVNDFWAIRSGISAVSSWIPAVQAISSVETTSISQ